MNLKELKQTIQDSPSSIFTKEDVLNLLNKVNKSHFTQTLADEMRYEINNQLKTLNEDEIVDFDSANFDLDDNKIILQGIEVDLSKIESIIETVLDDNVTEETIPLI